MACRNLIYSWSVILSNSSRVSAIMSYLFWWLWVEKNGLPVLASFTLLHSFRRMVNSTDNSVIISLRFFIPVCFSCGDGNVNHAHAAYRRDEQKGKIFHGCRFQGVQGSCLPCCLVIVFVSWLPMWAHSVCAGGCAMLRRNVAEVKNSLFGSALALRIRKGARHRPAVQYMPVTPRNTWRRLSRWV